MEIAVIVICICFAVTTYILSIFQFREKGILLNNVWLYASKEERNTMNKKPYYRQSGIVFFLIGIIFTLDAIWVITNAKWILYPVTVIVIVTIIYAIVSSIHNFMSDTKSRT